MTECVATRGEMRTNEIEDVSYEFGVKTCEPHL